MKKRSDTWKAEATERREVRQDKPMDAPLPSGGPKDRKRWCGGKQGREHTPKCMTFLEAKGTLHADLQKRWRILVCTTCGKELAHYYAFAEERRNPPEWVDK